MNLDKNIKLDFDDVLITPKRNIYNEINSRKDVNLNIKLKMPNSGQAYEGIPIFASNMATVGTIDAALFLQQYNIFTTLHKFYTNKEILDAIKTKKLNTDNFAPTFGISEKDKKNLTELILDSYHTIKYVSIDVANGYIQKYYDMIAYVRQKFPYINIIAGTVCTIQGIHDTYNVGADIVRVGLGSGANCTTRIKTGIGYPQFSAIYDYFMNENNPYNNSSGPLILSDGGCRTPGDIVKAFGAGAHFVMLGTMLAAHYENSNEDDIIGIKDENFVKVYGMSSETAMKKHYGKKEKYKTSEGRTTYIPYRGPLINTIEDILGGMRSASTYVGCTNFENFSNYVSFIRVTKQYNNSVEHYEKIEKS